MFSRKRHSNKGGTHENNIERRAGQMSSLVLFKRNLSIIGHINLVSGNFKQLDCKFLVDEVILGEEDGKDGIFDIIARRDLMRFERGDNGIGQFLQTERSGIVRVDAKFEAVFDGDGRQDLFIGGWEDEQFAFFVSEVDE